MLVLDKVYKIFGKEFLQLEKKDWEVIPECKFLDLYREDFTSDSVWQEVCAVFNKRYKKHITLLTVGIITEEDKNE